MAKTTSETSKTAEKQIKKDKKSKSKNESESATIPLSAPSKKEKKSKKEKSKKTESSKAENSGKKRKLEESPVSPPASPVSPPAAKKVKKAKKSKKEKVDDPSPVDQLQVNQVASAKLSDPSENVIVVADQHIDSYRPSVIAKHADDDIDENLRLENLGLVPSTLKLLQDRNVKALFPIQAAAYKPVIDGLDLLARARTGTGKTLAFSLPIVDSLKRLKEKDTGFSKRGRAPKCLIMAPTRELALQVAKELTQLCKDELATACFYGGTFYDEQMRSLADGLDIVIGTPGRLIDHIERGSLSLKSIRFVCLDEADQMLDIGFAEDMDKIIKLVIEQRGTHDHQTLLFSATMPDWIKNAVKNYMKPNRVTLDLIGSSKQKTSATVSHFKLPSRWQNRSQILGDVVAVYGNGNNGRTIIFVETKNEANELAMNEKLVSLGAQVLHGDISQNQREQTMQGYRDGKFTCLITTNVCARGVDIPEVDLVINAEPPSDVETYIHRSGRTGRAGRSGSCVTFYKADQEYLIEAIKRRAGVEFTKISAPQPSEIVGALASQSIHELTSLPASLLTTFNPAAQTLLAHFKNDATAAVSACFAVICGVTKQLKSRSLITANEGWVTLLFTTDKEMRNIGNVKSVFTHQSHPCIDVFGDFTGWRLAQDCRGVVVDVKEEKLDVTDGISIAGVKWRDGKGIRCEVCTELPVLQESYSSMNRGGARGGFGSRGRGGAYRGGAFRGGARGGGGSGGGFRGGRGGARGGRGR